MASQGSTQGVSDSKNNSERYTGFHSACQTSNVDLCPKKGLRQVKSAQQYDHGEFLLPGAVPCSNWKLGDHSSKKQRSAVEIAEQERKLYFAQERQKRSHEENLWKTFEDNKQGKQQLDVKVHQQIAYDLEKKNTKLKQNLTRLEQRLDKKETKIEAMECETLSLEQNIKLRDLKNSLKKLEIQIEKTYTEMFHNQKRITQVKNLTRRCQTNLEEDPILGGLKRSVDEQEPGMNQDNTPPHSRRPHTHTLTSRFSPRAVLTNSQNHLHKSKDGRPSIMQSVTEKRQDSQQHDLPHCDPDPDARTTHTLPRSSKRGVSITSEHAKLTLPQYEMSHVAVHAQRENHNDKTSDGMVFESVLLPSQSVDTRCNHWNKRPTKELKVATEKQQHKVIEREESFDVATEVDKLLKDPDLLELVEAHCPSKAAAIQTIQPKEEIPFDLDAEVKRLLNDPELLAEVEAYESGRQAMQQ